MVDVRKRVGAKGTTYQVRVPSKAAASGYTYKTFDSLKAARHYVENDLPKHRAARHDTIRSVEQAVRKWLTICEFEGREGRDAVSGATLVGYQWRAEKMLAYEWNKALHELEATDVRAFRSWLLVNYSRDTAKKVLSSLHSVLLEMVAQGVLAVDPGSSVTIQESRYKEPVRIPSVKEMKDILKAADDLANDKHYWIARAWERYRPMIYLAGDSGMRPQEYLVVPTLNILDRGVSVTQALDRDNHIGPPKTKAGRRFIPIGLNTIEMVRAYVKKHGNGPLVFPGENGKHQTYTNFLRRGWYKLMDKAGMMDEEEVDGAQVITARFTPYSLRHFFASMMIAKNVDLKTIQERMGHADAAMTLNVYGHLIRIKQAETNADTGGILAEILNSGVPTSP